MGGRDGRLEQAGAGAGGERMPARLEPLCATPNPPARPHDNEEIACGQK